MSKITIIEGNSNDKDTVRVIMVKGEKGYSAYDLYVKNGGTLTEEQWLNAFLNADNYYNKNEVDEKNNVQNVEIENEVIARANAISYLREILENQINTESDNRSDADNLLQSQISSLASGSPLAASSISGMTDTTKVYVNTSNGYWYYYNGTTWVSGGVYQASEDSQSVADIKEIIDYSNDYNLYNKDNVISGAYINSQGEVIHSSNPDYEIYRISDFIDLKDFDYLVLRYRKGTALAFYDINQTFIDRITSINVDTAIPTLRSSTQAKYIRICYKDLNDASGDYSKAMLYLTNDTTDVNRDYVPYNNIFIKKSKLPKLYYSDLIDDVGIVKFEPLFYPTGIKQVAWRGILYAKNTQAGETWFSRYAPENSFPAYRKAVEEGMDLIWLAGIRYSSDGVFYIMHDATTGRTCTTDITLKTSTSEQIDAVRLIQYGWTEWGDDDLKIPKFEDVIKLALQKNIGLGIRLGGLPTNLSTQDNIDLWDSFIALCRKYNLKNCIYSGALSQIEILNSYEPTWHVQSTGSSSDTEQDNIDNINALALKGFSRKSIILYPANLTENVMEVARNNDIYVFCVADEPLISENTLNLVKNVCVDGIITHAHIDL